MEKVKMTFEVITPFDILIDEENFKKEFNSDILKLSKYLYKEEGMWWEEKLKLVKAELLVK